MTEPTEGVIPRGLADLPLDARRARDAETHRELHDGLTHRHLHLAEYRQHYLAVQFARLLRAGPALAAKLRGK